MFYDDDHKLLHVHIPRTGGESIRYAMAMESTNYVINEPRIHASANEIRDFIGKRHWQDYYKFAVSRNPYEWYVSLWRYLMNNEIWLRKDPHWAKLTPKYMFHYKREFLLGTIDNWLFNFRWNCWSPNVSTSITKTTQVDWLNSDVDLWDINDIPKLVTHLKNISGIKLSVPHINISERKDFRSYYTSRSWDYVTKLNKTLINTRQYDDTFNLVKLRRVA